MRSIKRPLLLAVSSSVILAILMAAFFVRFGSSHASPGAQGTI
ncbi:MAG TPA: hypothetical protein VIC85_13010 [Ktedonobacterales bacterium]|jgi:hypothetical protein